MPEFPLTLEEIHQEIIKNILGLFQILSEYLKSKWSWFHRIQFSGGFKDSSKELNL